MGKLLALTLLICVFAGCTTNEPAAGGSELGVEAGATGSGAAGAPPDLGFSRESETPE